MCGPSDLSALLGHSIIKGTVSLDKYLLKFCKLNLLKWFFSTFDRRLLKIQWMSINFFLYLSNEFLKSLLYTLLIIISSVIVPCFQCPPLIK
jgi:hypothetical protein